jgi:prolipoprotein diacylglyceryltransferase
MQIWSTYGRFLTLYVELFCIQRFAIEFLRADTVPVLGPLSTTHIACLAIFLAVAGWGLHRARQVAD